MSNVSNDLIWECTKSNSSYLVKRKGIETVLSRDPYALNNRATHFESGLAHEKAVGVHYCKKADKICVITKIVKNANKPAKSRHIVEFKPTKSSRAIAKAVSKTVQGYKNEQIYDAIVRASAIKRAATVSKKQFAPRVRA